MNSITILEKWFNEFWGKKRNWFSLLFYTSKYESGVHILKIISKGKECSD